MPANAIAHAGEIWDRSKHEPSSNPYDNAFMESCFGTIKTEMAIDRYRNVEHARKEVTDFIRYYNTRRLHSSLDYKTPLAFEEEQNERQRKKLSVQMTARKALASLTHRRPGYPLASCVPTELASVSPSEGQCNRTCIHFEHRRHASKKSRGFGGWPP